MLVAGCLAEAQVFAERIEAACGRFRLVHRTGRAGAWCTAAVRSRAAGRAGVASAGDCCAVAALPPGYLAVFSHDELVAVVNPAGEDLWERHLRSWRKNS